MKPFAATDVGTREKALLVLVLRVESARVVRNDCEDAEAVAKAAWEANESKPRMRQLLKAWSDARVQSHNAQAAVVAAIETLTRARVACETDDLEGQLEAMADLLPTTTEGVHAP